MSGNDPPPSEPLPTSEVATSVAETPPDDPVPDGQETAEGTTVVTWFAIAGATLLVAVAAWWMVRRQGVEPPVVDEDWGADSEVI